GGTREVALQVDHGVRRAGRVEDVELAVSAKTDLGEVGDGLMSRPVEVGSQRPRLTRRVDGEEAWGSGVGRRQVDHHRGGVRRDAYAAQLEDVRATSAELAAVAARVEDPHRSL